jgi:RNA polymerase sigma factor (sigma-70 family)
VKKVKSRREINYLSRIEELDIKLKRVQENKERWLDIATNVTSSMGGERVQTSGNVQKMEDAIINSMDYDERIVELNKERDEIIKTIEQLPFKEYNVLYMKYVDRWGYYDIASSCGKSYSWVTSVHGRALQSLKKILDRRNEKQ